ncbi:uncharacterized protein FSUBG_13422 [Fusarium subglutinans]|uniref:2EXR domain-containing protein n=1 Tax=Gibberella subglutinans TaxID=42677 RepID=A0A8H5KW61_GIBSU|nr:uncharacterized protein FSUBG_13422 [Fusarium subglutinans]KAF5580309.1 hypothetical protein FSUBG_13422 [Fusarium subglutinans]
MEERTFHLFSQLPLELREQIWKMAMRPDKPGVQIFRVYNPELDNPRHAKDIYGFTLKPGSPRKYYNVPPCSYRLALPVWNKYPDSTDGSSDHNISTYLIDSSLWTVCQESRSMMRKTFGSNDASSQRLLGSATAHYLSGGAASYVTIYPEKDLIVLQFDDMFKFDWFFLYDLFNSNRWGCGIRNIGIEYQIEWGLDTSKGDEDPLYELQCIPLLSSIWLIDHNLKRREGTRRQKDSRKDEYRYPRLKKPFYANDRKFRKVNLEKEDDCMDHWKYLKLISDDYDDSSIAFANRLREDVWDTNVENEFKGSPCFVGLLGWDDI